MGRWGHGWRRRRALALTIALLAAAPLPSVAQAGDEDTAELRGTIVDGGTDLPLANVRVRLVGRQDDVGTRADGSFVFRDLAPGPYTIRVTALGYDQTEQSVTVALDRPTSVRVAVRPVPLGLAEIVVTPGRFGIMGTSAPVARQTLTREDLETIPQLGEDVFRTLQRIPGVAAGDISTRLNVRGGSDQEMLMTIDGIELYEPYHLKDFDGVLGIVDVQSVGGIDLITGGFPVEYGDKTAGVFNMQTAEPPVQRTRTAIGVSIMNLSFMSQGTFSEGDGSWLLSLRRGYLDIALALTDSDGNFSPNYWDALAKVRYRLGSNHTVSAHFLNANDDLTIREDGDPDYLESEWRSSYAWLGWQASFTPRLRAGTVASFGRVDRRRTGFEEFPEASPGLLTNFADDTREFNVFGVKQDWSYEVGDNVLMKVGFDAKSGTTYYDYFSRSQARPSQPGGEPGALDSTVVRVSPDGTELGAYAATRVRPFERLTAELGLRYDRQSHTGDEDLAPRIHAALDVGARTQLRASWGRYYQSHGLHELSVGDGETEYTRSEWAEGFALGLEHTFRNRLNVRVEGYRRDIRNPRRRFFNMSREILAFPETEQDRIRIDPSEARAKGVELILNQVVGRWSWAASYALSSTEGLVDEVWTPRFFDQTHVFQSLVSYGNTLGWQFSVGWQYHTGWPITPEEFSGGVVGEDPETGDPVVRVDHAWGALNSERLPAYHRLDLRVSRGFEVGNGTLNVFLDVFNLYNRGNLRSYGYDLRLVDGQVVSTRVGGEEMLPLLPSFGVRWEF